MAYYNSLSSLGENTLKQDDIIEFMGISYGVTKRYLSNLHDKYNNDKIFIILGIENVHTFCSNHYGYEATMGIWPEFKDDDFSAATRLVKALFKIIEDKKDVKVSEKSEKDKEVTINKPLKEESKLSVLLPSKHRNIKQITIQKEITFNKL